jgi:hypothetical protein
MVASRSTTSKTYIPVLRMMKEPPCVWNIEMEQNYERRGGHADGERAIALSAEK